MNKRTTKLIFGISLTILTIAIGTMSRAAVEVKAGSTPYTNITVSDSYNLCYNMRNNDSTLGSNTLDSHLTTNADWGAAAYLGLSAYGSVRSSTGTSVTINETSYYSTTNNITGVIDMGVKYTQTASLFPGASTVSYRTALEQNINTKYVETLGTTAEDAVNKGRACGETYGWYDSMKRYATSDYPVGMRKRVLGWGRDNDSYYSLQREYYGHGNANSDTTFRPVIWN